GWREYLDGMLNGRFAVRPQRLPGLLIGGGMLIMAGGLLSRSRLAWTMALLLALTGATSLMFGQVQSHLLVAYFGLMVLGLFLAWRQFDRSSVAASTLFAVTSVVMLLMY